MRWLTLESGCFLQLGNFLLQSFILFLQCGFFLEASHLSLQLLVLF